MDKKTHIMQGIRFDCTHREYKYYFYDGQTEEDAYNLIRDGILDKDHFAVSFNPYMRSVLYAASIPLLLRETRKYNAKYSGTVWFSPVTCDGHSYWIDVYKELPECILYTSHIVLVQFLDSRRLMYEDELTTFLGSDMGMKDNE